MRNVKIYSESDAERFIKDMKSCKGLFIDVDGTTVEDFSDSWIEGMQNALTQKYGVDIKDGFFKTFPMYMAQNIGGEKFSLAMTQHAIDVYNLRGISAEQLLKTARPFIDDVVCSRVKYKDNAVNLFKIFKERGVILSAVTSCGHNDLEHLRSNPNLKKEMPFDELFDNVVHADILKKGQLSKPAPDLYLLAIELLKNKLHGKFDQKKQGMAIEDSGGGVMSAMEASLRVLEVPTKGTEISNKASVATYRTKGYKEIVDIIKQK